MRKVSLFVFLYTLLFISCKKEEDVAVEPIVIVATPKVEFSYTPEKPSTEDDIYFTGKFLTGSSVITSWKWNFGDKDESISGIQNPVFKYSEVGTYTVSLTASDKNDSTMVISKEITVIERPPFPAEIAWSFTTETACSEPNDATSPIIGDDGIIYYAESYGYNMVAIEDKGNSADIKWESELGFRLGNAPSMDSDGNIYIGGWVANALQKISPSDGSIIWSGTTTRGISNCGVAIDNSNNVYVAARDLGVASWSTDGTKRWSVLLGGNNRYYSSPALSSDEATLYAIVAAATGNVSAINTDDGSIKWSVEFTGDATGTSVSIGANGIVYYTTNNEVGAIVDNGDTASKKWSYSVTGAGNSGVVVGTNGDLYVGTEIGLVSLDPNSGTEKWVHACSITESVPAVDSNGNIYVGTSDGKLIIVDPTGELKKIIPLTDNLVNSPLISDDGSVYVEAYDGTNITLFKINVENNVGPANSPWPMKGQNKKNTSLSI